MDIHLLRLFIQTMSKRVVKHAKLYFTDTGLLARFLQYPDPKLLHPGPMAGAFIENVVNMEILKRKLNQGLLEIK